MENGEILRHEDQLLETFKSFEQKRADFRIGAEMEKFGVRPDGSPIGYEGADGVRALLTAFAAKGWEEEREYTDGPVIALRQNDAAITLEPGSQFELSGAPFHNVHGVADELNAHMRDLFPLSAPYGVRWLGLGFHPFSKRADYTYVPKLRYGLMRDYLPTRGSLAQDMMLRTATVQANFDYASEADAMRKMRVGLRLAPLTAAIFANSPFYEGKKWGGKTYRARVWLDVDPDRSGLVPALLKDNAGYIDYIRWALNVPMFLVKRKTGILKNTGQTFADFWKNGFEGEKATVTDFQNHLGTVFPEVRMKKTIEIRSADTQGNELAPALSAMWAGIFYDDQALAKLDELTADYTHDELLELRRHIPEHALAATFRGKPLLALAEAVLDVAMGGLERRALKNAAGKDERIWLEPLVALVARGECPADGVLRRTDSHGGSFVDAVCAATSLEPKG